jgi:hypothetical protein
VGDRPLQHVNIPGPHPQEQLRGDERPVTAQGQAVERLPADELVGAVHVPGRDSQEDPAGQVPQPGIDLAHRRIGPVLAVADHRAGPLGARLGQESGQLRAPELPVGVGEEYPAGIGLLQRGRDAGANGRPVPPIDRVMNSEDPAAIAHREVIGDLPGLIVAAVIHDDDDVPFPH